MASADSFAATPEGARGGRVTALALAAILVLTALRVGLLALDRSELLTDEAQYWLWSREMAAGAYSKPPLIGWLIRAVTDLCGGMSVFSVRLASPLLHGATAVLVLWLGHRLAGARVGAAAALCYLTAPAIAYGAGLMTTDTPLLLAIAAALALQHGLAATPPGARARLLAVALGLVTGLGFLAKYAMLYAIAGAAVAALLAPEWRIRRGELALAAGVALVVIAPNLWWNASHGFATVRHVAGDARWEGPRLHPLQVLEFLAEQLAVMGPILFGAWLVALVRAPRLTPGQRGLLGASATVLGIVAMQALTTRALANWGVGFVVGGSVAAAVLLVARPRLLRLSLAIGLVLSLLLPVLRIGLIPGAEGLLRRNFGHAEIGARALDFARGHGATTLVATERDLLALLSWAARGEPLAIRALPRDGAPEHHWDLLYPLSADDQPVVAVTYDAPPACDEGAAPLASDAWTAGPGFAAGHKVVLSLLPAGCRPLLRGAP